MRASGKRNARHSRVESKTCLARPQKVPPLTRSLRSLPPARPATLPRPGCPPPAPAGLRSPSRWPPAPCRAGALLRAALPQRGAVHRCSGRSHGAVASARPSGRVCLAPLPSPACERALTAPRPQGGGSAAMAARRAPRILASGAQASAIPPKAPPHPAAPACAPVVLDQAPAITRVGALPQTPGLSPARHGGEQLLRASLGRCAAHGPSVFSDGIPAEFPLYRKA